MCILIEIRAGLRRKSGNVSCHLITHSLKNAEIKKNGNNLALGK